jgi:hypothetical protein
MSIGLHAWSITSITSINPRAADSVKNILQYRHINGGIVQVQTRTTEAGVRGGTPAPGRLWGMHGDDVTAGGGCGAHCAVRQGSSGSADSATGKLEQPGAGRRLGGGVEWACRRAESANTASIALQGMGQRLVAVSALLVQAVFKQMSPLIFHCVIYHIPTNESPSFPHFAKRQ